MSEWINWDGGVMPLRGSDRVEVQFADGAFVEDFARCFIWTHEREAKDRIIAYKLVNSETESETDNVNNPAHYTSHPSGVKCIDIAEEMGFNLGNVIKYVWRCGLKLDAIEDLEKAEFYLKREIAKRKKQPCETTQ